MADGNLSYEDFLKLSEKERGKQYQYLSDSDKFKVRQGMVSCLGHMFHVMTASTAIGELVKPIRGESREIIFVNSSKTTTSNAGRVSFCTERKIVSSHQAEMQGGFFMLIFACEGGVNRLAVPFCERR